MARAAQVLAVLQARVSSRRLPGKVLLPVLGRPMLARQIERIRRACRLDALVVATSDRAEDDAIAELCRALEVDVHRGALDDVLDRFHSAAAARAPEHVVRLTGDCPLIDPSVIDDVVRVHVESGADYTSNAVERTYPDGLDVEAMRMSALATAWREARLPSEREHVTPFLYRHPERFLLRAVKLPRDLSALRWVVDHEVDLALVRAVYERLHPRDPAFDMHAVLALMRSEPQLFGANQHVPADEGWQCSVQADAAFLRHRGTR
jgi:spore coat polysaccharide biosynthesis protein SpsF